MASDSAAIFMITVELAARFAHALHERYFGQTARRERERV
jgi:hypothetical protein